MGTRMIEVRQVECDRCKTTEDTGQMDGRNTWGELSLNWRGHSGGRGYDGAAGGCNHNGGAWLCMRCTNAFFTFMLGAEVPGITKE